MDILQELTALEERAHQLYKDTRVVVAGARREVLNKRLDRHDVEGLLGYSTNYTYGMDIPFNSRGYILYNDLHRWVSKHKPNRLSRLENNYKSFIKEFITEMKKAI